MNEQLETVRLALESHRCSPRAKEGGSSLTAKCPAHEDKRASLSVSVGDKQPVVISCHAACPPEEVVKALGLSWSDLCEPRDAPPQPRASKKASTIAATYPYADEHGVELFQAVRKEPKDFLQRHACPKGKDGWTWSMSGDKCGCQVRRVLYRLPKVLEAAKSGGLVLVVEGEKDVHSLEALGFVATTAPGGAAAPWREDYSNALTGAHVVILPDNDGPGRKHGSKVAQALRGKVASIRMLNLPDLPEKGDVTDWIQAGGTREGLERLLVAPQTPTGPGPAGQSLGDEPPPPTDADAPGARPPPRVANVWDTGETEQISRGEIWAVKHVGAKPQIMTMPELLSKGFDPLKWVVPRILPEGLFILGGKPKCGKSWLCLDLAIAVAIGGAVLGEESVEPGHVLYLSLEDNERRLQRRAQAMLKESGGQGLERLSVVTTWARSDQGGVEDIERWVVEHPGTRLVIVDTLAKWRPPGSSKGSLYEQDYAALQGLKALADKHSLAVLVVHHLRKAGDDDPVATLSGTMGLAGGADGTLILDRVRGSDDAILHISGRDIEDDDPLGLVWRKSPPGWNVQRDAKELSLSPDLRATLDIIKKSKTAIGPTAVHEKLGKLGFPVSLSAVKKRLLKLEEDGHIAANGGGRYQPSITNWLDSARASDLDPELSAHGQTPSPSHTVTEERVERHPNMVTAVTMDPVGTMVTEVTIPVRGCSKARRRLPTVTDGSRVVTGSMEPERPVAPGVSRPSEPACNGAPHDIHGDGYRVTEAPSVAGVTTVTSIEHGPVIQAETEDEGWAIDSSFSLERDL